MAFVSDLIFHVLLKKLMNGQYQWTSIFSRQLLLTRIIIIYIQIKVKYTNEKHVD